MTYLDMYSAGTGSSVLCTHSTGLRPQPQHTKEVTDKLTCTNPFTATVGVTPSLTTCAVVVGGSYKQNDKTCS